MCGCRGVGVCRWVGVTGGWVCICVSVLCVCACVCVTWWV